MSGVRDLLGESQQNDDGNDAELQQSKSLVANVYSTDKDDNYKNLSDWEWYDELAYKVTANGGTVRNSLKRLAPSGSHEEWYCKFQTNLAHYIGDIIGTLPELPEDEEPKGATPLMEFLGFDSGDIIEYLGENPEMAQEVFSSEERVRELIEQNQEEEEEQDE